MARLRSTAIATDIAAPISPRELLLRYQRRYSADSSQYKIWLKARQIGGDFTQAEEIVRDCLVHELEDRRSDWVIAAPSERQSLLSFQKCQQWVQAYGSAMEQIEEDRPAGSESVLTAARIVLPGGSTITAVPGKPETVRGFTCNAALTEFGFFENPDETWRALFFTTANNFSGKKKVRLLSTPNGIGNKLHAIWVANYQNPKAVWSCHKTDIHSAVADGLPVDIERLRSAICDPDGWSQEMELEFLDASLVLLPYELIATCESSEASIAMPFDYWNTDVDGGRFCGIDFGRSRDMTCAIFGERRGSSVLVREVIELRKMATQDQIEFLMPRMSRCEIVSVDYTGPGIGFGDIAVSKLGEWKVEQHKFGKVELNTFTIGLKQEIFPKMRVAFESRRIIIPSTRALREDLHSVYRTITNAGNVTYAAPHTDDGHSDRANALALLIRAFSYVADNVPASVDLI